MKLKQYYNRGVIMITVYDVIDSIADKRKIDFEQFSMIINNSDTEADNYLFSTARKAADRVYDNKIYIRGLIEFTNYCKNNCYYCGIRRSNSNISRYRLSKDDILSCTDTGYALGFRTFVLQGGEDIFYDDDAICDIVYSIKEKHSDCAVTLSIGEKNYLSYKRYFDAGADRYLLRHETADSEHYKKLHPKEMSYDNRIRCLYDLKSIGYQTGCGFMAGSPYQTVYNMYKDIEFICRFRPHMVGIGPFIPHHDTPFADMDAGTLNITLRLIAVIRLLMPDVLLPATTALGTIAKDGRIKGISAGANVVMPNLSPADVRSKYMLYDHKAYIGNEAAEGIKSLKKELESKGYEIEVSRGDHIKIKEPFR